MTKLIALHELHLASAAGGVDIINPGQAFVATPDEARSLTKRDYPAARLPIEGGEGYEGDDNAKMATRGKAADRVVAVEDLSKLKKSELLAIAEKELVAIKDGATNPEIVAAIEAHRAEAGGDNLLG